MGLAAPSPSAAAPAPAPRSASSARPAPGWCRPAAARPRPWIGQPRGASTRLQVTNSSPPSGSGVIVCTSPLPSVELPTTTPRPRSASAAARISAALAVRPSTSTTTGMPGQFAGRRTPDARRLGVASGGHRDDAGRQQVVGRRDRLPQQPAAVAAQVEDDAFGRTRPGEALLDRLREVAVGAAVEGGHLDHQHVADALHEDGFRRHHGAFDVAPSAGDRRDRARQSSSGFPPARRSSSPRVAGSLPWADWPSTDTIVSPGRMPASAPGPSEMASTTTMAAPRRTRRRPAPA